MYFTVKSAHEAKTYRPKKIACAYARVLKTLLDIEGIGHKQEIAVLLKSGKLRRLRRSENPRRLQQTT